MPEKLLNECPDFGPLQDPYNIDNPTAPCVDCPKTPSQQDVHGLGDPIHTKTGIGRAQLCDPFQKGRIVNDLHQDADRSVIYRYSKAIRGCDEAMLDLFRGMVVIDELGVAHPVPIMWATQERAVAAAIQTNVRKDDSLVVDRVRLPMLALHSSNFTFAQDRYTYHLAYNYFRDKNGRPKNLISEKRPNDTVLGIPRGFPVDVEYQLIAWTMYVEDMYQIIEQITTKFSQLAYIRIQGVQWETAVKLDSIANNIDMEPGDTAQRVIKYQFGMTAQTYIPQPIARKKTVLSEKVEFANSVKEEEIIDILSRFEINA